jgi:hypothetical protein
MKCASSGSLRKFGFDGSDLETFLPNCTRVQDPATGVRMSISVQIRFNARVDRLSPAANFVHGWDSQGGAILRFGLKRRNAVHVSGKRPTAH